MRKEQDYQGAGSVAVQRVAKAGKAARGRTVGIGLIGCGGMGRYVAQKVADQSPRLRIRGLYDPDRRSLQASRKVFGEDVPVYQDYRALGGWGVES